MTTLNQERRAEILYIRGEVPGPWEMMTHLLLRWSGRISSGRISEDYDVVPAQMPFRSPKGVEKVFTLSHSGSPIKNWRVLIPEAASTIKLNPAQLESLQNTAKYLNHYCHFERKQPSPSERLAKSDISPFLYNKLIEISVRHFGKPREALIASGQFLSAFVLDKNDPFLYQKGKRNLEEDETRRILIENSQQQLAGELSVYKRLANIGPKTSFETPILKKTEHHETGKTEIEGWQTFERELNRLRILEKSRVRFTIVGPANSGKSTLTASIHGIAEELIDQARSDYLPDLRLSIGIMDLDPQSPQMAQKIFAGNQEFDQTKTPWSESLAITTAKEFIDRTENIIIADSPGGHPDKITEAVVGPTDLTLLLIGANDDESWRQQQREWQTGLKAIGQVPVADLRSRRVGEIGKRGKLLESMITSSHLREEDDFFSHGQWIDRVGGRIVGLDRKIMGDDSCITTLTKFLLFDLLPQAVINRKRHTLLYLSKLRDEQVKFSGHFLL